MEDDDPKLARNLRPELCSVEEREALWQKAEAHPQGFSGLTPEEQMKLNLWEIANTS
jgi:hypothetical protein